MASQPIAVRCRSKIGQHSITDLQADSTLLELKAFVLSATGFEYDKLVLKVGVPPQTVSASDHTLLKDCGITHGVVVIAEESTAGQPNRGPPVSSAASAGVTGKRPSGSHQDQAAKVKKDMPVEHKPSVVKRQVVPANNSCLFASIHYCLYGKVDQSKLHSMRKAVADKVLSTPDTYTEALLGRSPTDYATFIKNPDSWGGAIELSILCDLYRVQIDVVDIENQRTETFGQGHDNKILLLYDGIHYDPLYEAVEPPRRIFPASDDLISAKALDLAMCEKDKRQYTNTNKFSIKCLVCGAGMVGQREAVSHANATGHINFGEF